VRSNGWSWYTITEIESWGSGHKRCRCCDQILPLTCFGKNKNTLLGVDTKCKDCRKPKSKQDYLKQTVEFKLYHGALGRSKERGLAFNIEISDIVIPSVCPILGVPLTYKGRHSPSLDRIDSSLGYVKGNVQVISKQINCLKKNVTIEELEKLLKYMKGEV
jgi:hypothetical protein